MEITNETDLTESYGLGKFCTFQDQYLWELTLDGGADEEEGEADVLGWAGLLNGPFEHPQLADVVGAILFCDSQGFVTSTTYTDKAALKDAWIAICKAVETNETEGGLVP